MHCIDLARSLLALTLLSIPLASCQHDCINPSSSGHAFSQLCRTDMDPQLVLRDRLVSYPLGTLRNDSSEGVTEKAATPWTEEPFCLPGQDAEQALCVYTDADFAQGRGISLITSQSSAQQVSKHTAFNYPEQLEEGNRALNDVYEVRPLKDRGFGLVAKGKLGRGTRIFSHTPVIAAQLAAEKLPDEELFPLLQVAVQRLPNETRKKFMALHGHFGGDEIYDKFQTNGFRVFDYAAVFPETSVSRTPSRTVI